MNISRLIVLGIAVVAAVMAAVLVKSMSSSQGPAVAALEKQGAVLEVSEVLVATRNIAVGETMVANDFRWQSWPKDAVHASFITRSSDGTGRNKWVGAVLRTPVFDGEPLTGHKMVHIGEGGVMAAIIGPGLRGIGVKISAETGAGGFILPNDRVDVITTFVYKSPGDRTDKYASETILHNVRVLAIDQTFREQDGQQVVVGRTATLELDSLQAEDLALAAERGEVSLALRSLAGEGSNDSGLKIVKDRRKSNQQVAVIRNGRASGSR